MRLSALCLLLLAGGCATSAEERRVLQAQEAADQQRLRAALAGLTPSEPTNCLPTALLTSNADTAAFGPTILYKVSNRLIYRTDTTGGCGEAMARGDILVTVSPTGRLCRGDIAHTVEPVSHVASGGCALGPFTRYSRPRP